MSVCCFLERPLLDVAIGSCRELVQDCLFTQEEGGDDVKSVWPLRPGLHTCYNGAYRATRGREAEQIAESAPQFGSGSATRPREVGFASNGVSATTP